MIIKSDVLVIGGGAAAGSAAIEAYDNGASVIMVMKGVYGISGVSAYKIAEILGYNVADGGADQSDSPDVHYKDIMRAAAGMADPHLAKIIADGALGSLRELEKLNVPFHKTENDKYFEVLGCFATKPRMHLIPGHAEPIVHAQKKEILKRGIPIYEWSVITKLIVENNKVVGAVGLNKGGDILEFQAKSIFLGTGGAGQLFSHNINPSDITGDGYSLGFRAGAKLINMEFMQAGPGLIYPCKNMFNSWLWAVHPKVKNGNGEEFIHNYLPKGMSVEQCMNLRSGHYPFSSYDGSQWIDISIQTEIKEGRKGPHGGVIVDFTEVDLTKLTNTPRGNEIRKSWEITVNWLLENRKLDLRTTPVEVAILGHAINGGLYIDENSQTTIQGLYTSGETSGGPHGADRLGGNMVLTCLVFGKRAGHSMAQYIKNAKFSSLPNYSIDEEKNRIQDLLSKNGSIKPHHIKKILKEIMWRHALVIRSEESLSTALLELERLKEEFKKDLLVTNNKELLHAIEAENLILIGEIICKAAISRKETRGSHYRIDFPGRDDQNYLHRIFLELNEEIITTHTINSDPETVTKYPYHIVHA